MITHDRYFLDRVTNRIAEIDGEGFTATRVIMTTIWKSKPVVKKWNSQASGSGRLFIKKGAGMDSQRRKGAYHQGKRQDSAFSALSDSKLVIDDSSLEINTVSSRLGKKIIELQGNLQKLRGFASDKRFQLYSALRNDRVGIIGPNGRGKSTLLGIIMGGCGT